MCNQPWIRSWLCSVALAAPLLAQQTRVDRLPADRSRAASGSAQWFVDGFDLVDALLNVDVAAAMREALRLWQAVDERAPRGVADAAAVVAALASAHLDGPRAAAEWIARAGAGEPVGDGAIAIVQYLARARVLCLSGEHRRELEYSIPGEQRAREHGDPVLRLRAAFVTLHATPQRSVLELEREFDAVGQVANGAAIESLRPWLWAEQFRSLAQAGQVEAAARCLDRIEQRAEIDGDLRLACWAAGVRVAQASDRRDLDGMLTAADHLRGIAERLGDRRECVGARDLVAWTHVLRGEFEAAGRLLDEAEAMLVERGFRDLEQELLHTRFELAVRQRDGDAAAAFAAELELRRAAERERLQQAAAFRARLERVERDREQVAASLQRQQADTARAALEMRINVGLALLAGLACLVVVVAQGSRRLRRANKALAEQVREVEQARAVHASLLLRMRALEHTESVGLLAAGVGHDFNNLLTGMLGNAELLRAELGQPDAVATLDQVIAAGRQAARLCRKLQAHADGSPPVLELWSLHDIVEQDLPVLRASGGAGVDVRLDPVSKPVSAMVDRVQFEQILLNLVVNARDANARHIRFVVGIAHHVTGIAGPAAVLHVVDDGEGMPPAVLERIFDPFFTTRFPGRGLGLAVVHGAIRRLGGTVTVDSRAGVGTRFSMYLPLTEAIDECVASEAVAPDERVVVVTPLPPPRRDPVVLVVDDEPAVRGVLRRMLGGTTHDVRICADSEQALAMLDGVADVPVLVLADLAMPGIDGIELLRRVRARRPDARLALMSGHPPGYIEQVAGDLQVDRVLAKPFDKEALTAVIAELAGPRDSRPSAAASHAVSPVPAETWSSE